MFLRSSAPLRRQIGGLGASRPAPVETPASGLSAATGFAKQRQVAQVQVGTSFAAGVQCDAPRMRTPAKISLALHLDTPINMTASYSMASAVARGRRALMSRAYSNE